MPNQSVFYKMFAFANSLFVFLMVCLQRRHIAACPCQNHVATTEVREIESSNYPNFYSHNANCRYELSRPSTMSDYYFELQWRHLDVRGRMPTCLEDYVEVFVGFTKLSFDRANHGIETSYSGQGYKVSVNLYGLTPCSMGERRLTFNSITRNESSSLGRLCSGGLESLHPIYTLAKKVIIHFRSDDVDVGRGFRLAYRLRNLRDPLTIDNFSRSPSVKGGIIHTNNWPRSLEETEIKRYFVLQDHEYMQFTFMDIDFRNSVANLYSRECIIHSTDMAITAFNQSSKWISAERFSLSCKDQAPKVVTLNGGSVIVRIDIQKSSTSIRGFVAGYLTYKREPESSEAAINDKTVLVSLLTGIGLGIVITVTIYITVSILIKKRIL